MTIEKGRPWGAPGRLGADGAVARTDAEVAALVEAARAAGVTPPDVGLLGGDLCRTLGGRGDEARLRGSDAMRLPIDVGCVVLDGVTHRFVAHLVVRGSWWRGRVVAVMNAEWIGDWDVAPRSHPNDGLLDVLDGDLSLGDRWKARSRLPSGSHLPHPGIAVSRLAELDLELDRPATVWLDGVRVATARRLAVRVEPDAFHVIV